mmetsp:Transcript_9876/g.15147  ORF Transcript_9876/g.15147 Transcript_9876/m.15147 type:complete len:230 (-) Transcript_9876:174-863(-)
MKNGLLLLPLAILSFIERVSSFSYSKAHSIDPKVKCCDFPAPDFNRRNAIKAIGSVATSALLVLSPQNAVASEERPKQSIDVVPPPTGEAPLIELQNGVKVKDFKSGTGDATVKADSSVQIQCSGKLLNLNGVSFYNTKNNNPDGFGAVPLTIKLGRGEAIPGLESGIVGMRKGGIRRIIIPPELAYSKFPDLEPKPMNANDQRALDSVVKNPRRDATILFDVSLERFK